MASYKYRKPIKRVQFNVYTRRYLLSALHHSEFTRIINSRAAEENVYSRAVQCTCNQKAKTRSVYVVYIARESSGFADFSRYAAAARCCSLTFLAIYLDPLEKRFADFR